MATKHVKSNYDQITDHIYIGTNFCCSTHFSEELKKEGITTDISLEEIKIDSPFGVQVYLWLPVKDGHAPTPYQFQVGIYTLMAAEKNNQKIYVHCKNGHGRAPTLVAAHLIKSKGVSPKEAVEMIRKKRPEIHLEKVQWEALEEFQKTL